MKLKITIFLLVASLTGVAQQTFQWSVKAGGKGMDVSGDIVAVGNDSYLAGSFSGSFASGSLSGKGIGENDAVLLKINKNGHSQWMKAITGSGSTKATRITASRNVLYLGGSAEGTITADKTSFENKGSALYVSSWTEQGKINWLTRLPYSGLATLDVLEPAPDGTILAGGMFQGSLSAGSDKLASPDEKRAFLASIAPDGRIIRTEVSSGNGNHRLVSASFGWNNERVLLFSVTGDFSLGKDQPVIMPDKAESGLVLSRSVQGRPLWSVLLPSMGYVEGVKALTSTEGEITVCLNFSKSITIGDFPLPARSQLDAALLTFGSNGKLNSVRNVTGLVSVRIMDAHYTKQGNLIVSGYFRDGYQVGQYLVKSKATRGDMFLFQVGKSRNVDWHDEPGEETASFTKAFTLDQEGNILLAGAFNGSLKVKNEKHTSDGLDDILVAKYFNCLQKEVNIEGNTLLCKGSETVLSAIGDYSGYEWSSTNKNKNTITVTEPGIYSVRAFDKEGCFSSDTVMVQTAQPPSLGLPAEVTVSSGQSVLLTAADGFVSYLWENGENSPDRLINYSNKGNSLVATLVAVSPQGCSVSQSVTVQFLKDSKKSAIVPGYFSVWPNPVTATLSWFTGVNTSVDLNLTLTDEKSVTVYSATVKNYVPYSVSTVDMSSLPPGTYLFTLRAGPEVYYQKVIKK